ncbi:MAG TPA: hypothetical protein VF053_14395 [Streptosporangiales bacterium]
MRPVYDVVLLPPDHVNRASIQASERLRDRSVFTLNNRDAVPHLSLYMANIREEDLGAAKTALAELGRRTPGLSLTAREHRANEHGMVEVFYEKTPGITRLQEDVIAAVNPLRDGLRELDPVGRSIAERMRQATGELADNFNTTGYDEVGGYFKPHITYARLSPGNRGQQPGAPDLTEFDGRFERLGLFRMGEDGRCVEKLGEWRTGGRGTAGDGAPARTQGRQQPRLGREQRDPSRVPAARQPER